MSHNLYNSTKAQKQALHSLLTGSIFCGQDSKFGQNYNQKFFFFKWNFCFFKPLILWCFCFLPATNNRIKTTLHAERMWQNTSSTQTLWRMISMLMAEGVDANSEWGVVVGGGGEVAWATKTTDSAVNYQGHISCLQQHVPYSHLSWSCLQQYIT